MSEIYDELNITFAEPEERQFTVFAKGIYKFRILEINAVKLSRETRVPMLPIKFEFSRADGETTTVYNNFLMQSNALWVIHQFLKCIYGDRIATGKNFNLNNSDTLEHIKRQTGTARLKVEKVRDKDYDRNSIDAFIFAKDESAPAKAKAPPPDPAPVDDDDDIPF